jgi:ketosteroid isomerase-like protein
MKRILATTLLILSATTLASAQCSEADKQKLMALDKAWSEVGQRGDRAALQNIYADDYMNPAPTGTLNKTQTIDEAVRDAERIKANPQAADQVSHDHYVITCTPNTATITHRNVVTSKVNGKDHHSYTRSAHFLEKRGGEWKVVSDAGGPLGDAGQLLYLEMEWAEADMKNDVAWFERTFADNFSGISSTTGKLNTKAEEIAEVKNRKEVFTFVAPSDMQVRINGDTGVVTGVYHMKGRDEKGQPLDRRIRYTDVYVKRDGRWQVLASQGTLIK